MNSSFPDNDAPHMREVLLTLKDLAARLTALEKRSAAYPATALLPPSHLPKIPKESDFPPPIPTTNYRLPKTEVEGSEKKKRGVEGEYTGHQGTPSAGESMPPPRPSNSVKPAQSTEPSAPLQPAESPRVCCTLWVPDSIAGHLIGQAGCRLKLAATISKARIAVSGPSTELGAARKVTIHSTSEEVGMALVVMGKRIAQQHVPNLWRKPKPKKPTPTTSTTTEGRD
jgi:hypothetical protein